MSTEKYIPLHILEKITNEFSAHSRIGTGGYGDVYKAVYNEREVAVKLLHVDTVQGIDDQQYINEVGNLLTVNHPNIVQLLGYCYETRSEIVVHNGKRRLSQRIYRVLCFEYLQCESLDKRLPEESFAPDWSTRYMIIKGICEGLDFLHRCEPPIFHLDLKPANILLDSSMMPKVADFGLSRLFGGPHTHVTQQIKGTQMYMPPEFINGGNISHKNDVFGLGVVMIEIMTGPSGDSSYTEMDEVAKFKHKIKTLPFEHNCPTTKLSTCTMASQAWIADRIEDWVKKNPGVGAKDARAKLQDEYNIKLEYNKTWYGMKVALDQIHGSYEDCFPLLFNWKAEIEQKSPGSIVEIELLKNGNKYHFNRMFVAFKPCIDGFLAGCRLYVGVDSTALNGKFKGQLASATTVDGHNWLYYVAFAVFDSETGPNWEWFMKQLHRAIGSPPGLVISSDACKGLETAIDLVFPDCENRECMRHLYSNFMKKFHGKVYMDNLYPAARTFSDRKFRHHMNIIKEANPEAIEYLDMYHHRLWYKCGFGEASKVDYLTNNISESFNKQIKDFKGLNLCNLFDRIRELVTEKFCVRRLVSEKLNTGILPHVIKQLNALSKTIGRNKILWTTEHEAEVTLLDLKFVKRHIVNLQNRTCTCRVWQVSGKPCMHALAFICSINGAEIQTYVEEKFKAAYAGRIPTMTDKSQWINVDLGFKVHPPLQQVVAGRPRVQRIRGWLEPGRKIVKCKRCKAPGHMEKTCKVPDPKYVAVDDDIHDNVPDPFIPTKKRKKDDETTATIDGDASDDETLINLIRKKARTTPQKPNTPSKKKTPVKIATTQEKAKKTPVKKAASQEKAKKKTPVRKATTQEKAKKKTPVKKPSSKGKKAKKNVPFAPVISPPPPSEMQPISGAKRSLLYWLGG